MNIDLNSFVIELYKKANTKDLLIEIGMKHFLEHERISKRLATYKYYVNKFYQLLKYFNSVNISFISQINNQVLLTYIEYLQNKNLKASSINKLVGAIKTLIFYLTDLDLIAPINIKIKKLKEETPKIQTIDLNTLGSIIDYLKKNKSNQNLLIFELFLQTGIRRTELVNITRNNIDFINNSIYLETTKTGQPRYIYFDNSVGNLIKYELKYKPHSKFLFCNHDGKQISTSQIDSLFLRIKKELNIEILSPHKLRHTFATMIMDKGHDIEQLRILMGHTTYEMTKRYLHIKNKKLQETALSCNPLTLINNKY